MATFSLKAYETAVTVLATELNSLASGSVSGLTGSGTGSVLDNTSLLDIACMFILTVTFGSAPTAANVCSLYYAESLDGGTTYDTMVAAGTTLPQPGKLVGNFVLETAGTTQAIVIAREAPFTMHPGKYEFQLVNSAGVAFPASGSTVKAYAFNMTVA